MSQIVAQHLKAGFVFGDHENGEYVYLPGGEIGADEPLCVLETPSGRRDVTLPEAVQLVLTLSLKPTCYFLLWWCSC